MVPSHSTGRPVPARTACTVMAGDPQSRRPWGLSPAPVRRALAFPWEQLLPGPRRQFAGRGFGFRGKAEAGHFHQTVCRTGSHWLPKDRGDLRGSKPLTGADSGEQLAGLCRWLGPCRWLRPCLLLLSPGLGTVRQWGGGPPYSRRLSRGQECAPSPAPHEDWGQGRAAAPTPALPPTGLWFQAELRGTRSPGLRPS